MLLHLQHHTSREEAIPAPAAPMTATPVATPTPTVSSISPNQPHSQLSNDGGEVASVVSGLNNSVGHGASETDTSTLNLPLSAAQIEALWQSAAAEARAEMTASDQAETLFPTYANEIKTDGVLQSNGGSGGGVHSRMNLEDIAAAADGDGTASFDTVQQTMQKYQPQHSTPAPPAPPAPALGLPGPPALGSGQTLDSTAGSLFSTALTPLPLSASMLTGEKAVVFSVLDKVQRFMHENNYRLVDLFRSAIARTRATATDSKRDDIGTKSAEEDRLSLTMTGLKQLLVTVGLHLSPNELEHVSHLVLTAPD